MRSLKSQEAAVATKQGVLIRRATPADDSSVGTLLVDSFVSTYAQKMPEVVVTEKRKLDLRDTENRRKTAFVLVAEREDGQLLGTITINPVGLPGSKAWLPNAVELRMMAVRADAQGKGVASELLKAAHRVARESGAQAACLHVRRGAVGVARFYVAHDYQREPEADLDLLPEIFLEAYTRPL